MIKLNFIFAMVSIVSATHEGPDSYDSSDFEYSSLDGKICSIDYDCDSSCCSKNIRLQLGGVDPYFKPEETYTDEEL